MESTGKLDAIQVSILLFKTKAFLTYLLTFKISKHGADILASEGYKVQRRGVIQGKCVIELF